MVQPTSLSASHEIQAGTIISSGSGHFGLTLSGNDLIAAGALQIGAAGGASDPRAGGNFATIAGAVSVGSQLTGSDVIVCGRLRGDTIASTGSITAGTTLIATTNVSGADVLAGGRAQIGKGITIGGGIATDTQIIFDGNAKDFYFGLDDSEDKLVIGEGSTVGTNNILTITDDTVVVGDGAAVDTQIRFEGNAQDFHIGLDDTADMFIIGSGSVLGENAMMRFTTSSAGGADSGLKVYVGDGMPADMGMVFDGNAKDFYLGLKDNGDKFMIGTGSVVGSGPVLTFDAHTVTLGHGAAADSMLVFDGAAADYRVGIDDGTDKLEIGAGATMGTTAAIIVDSSGDVTKIGTDSPSDGQVLTWDNDNTKVVWSAAGGTSTDSSGSNMGQPIPLSPALPLSGGLNYGAGTLGSSITVTLPASGAAGDTVIVKGHSNLSPSNTVTIDGAGSDTIDGEAVVVLQSAFASVTCVCIDGANWVIV